MNQNSQSHVPASIPAVYMDTKSQHQAFGVVDAVDDLHDQLSALRAVAQLAESENHSADGLPQLRRGDLAKLLSVIGSDLETHCHRVRGMAMNMVPGSPQGANPV